MDKFTEVPNKSRQEHSNHLQFSLFEQLEQRLLLSADVPGLLPVAPALDGSCEQAIEINLDNQQEGNVSDEIAAIEAIESLSLEDSEETISPVVAEQQQSDNLLNLKAPELLGLQLVKPDISSWDGQIIYLDFDGQEDVTYNGPVTVEFDVPDFQTKDGQAGQELVSKILAELQQTFAGTGIIFTTLRPQQGIKYSTIYIGGDDSVFSQYGSFRGLAEKVDASNADQCDEAFVFSDGLSSEEVASVVIHELGHLLGYEHEGQAGSAENKNLADVADATVVLQNQITSLSEDTDTTTRIKVADIVVTDDGVGTNVLTLTGPDAGLFEIDPGVVIGSGTSALYLQAGATLDHTYDLEDYLSDPSCVAYYRFESGSLGFDSVGTNQLSVFGPSVNTSDFIEGGASAEFSLLTDRDRLICLDSNLDTGFPMKSDDATRNISTIQWIKFSDFGPEGHISEFWGKYATNNLSYRLSTLNNGTDTKVRLTIGYQENFFEEHVTFPTAIQTDRWYCIASTYQYSDSTYRIRIYDYTANAFLPGNSGVDFVGNFANSVIVGNGNFILGYPSDSFSFSGLMDSCLVFNRVLSTSELEDIRLGMYGQNNAALEVKVNLDDAGIPGTPDDSVSLSIALTSPDNNAPVLGAIGDRIVDEGSLLTFTAGATDSNFGDVLTFSLDPGAPAGASINPVTGVFTWTPGEAQGPGVYSVTVRVTDDGSPNRDDHETINITVNEVNTTPVLAANTGITVDEGGTEIIDNTELQVTDADLPAQTLTYTIQTNVANGTLYRSGVALGTNDTFTQADINAGIISYVHDGSETLTDSFVFNVSDGNGGMIGNTTFNITVTPVGDEPVLLDIEDTPLVYLENAGPVIITNTITITDPDDTNIESAVIRISNNYQSDQDILRFNNAVNINGYWIWDALTGTLTHVGTDTLARYQAALRNITYENTAENPNTLSRTVSFTVNDGSADSNISNRVVSVNNVNDAPVLTPIGNQSVDEGNQLSFTASATDIDLPADVLTFSLDPGAPAGASIDPVTGEFTWTPGEDQGPGVYPVTVRVTDNGTPNLYDHETITVTVNEVNVAPVPNTNTGINVDEGGTEVINNTELQVTDADVPAQTLTYTIQTNVAHGTLYNFGVAMGTNDTFTQADIDAGNISYVHDGSETTADSFVFSVSDGGGGVIGNTTFDITINQVNDAPVLSAIEASTLGYTDIGNPVIITNTIEVSDVDNANLTGATVSISSGYVNGEDTLSFTNQLGITGNWNPATGTLTLSGAASVADYQTALRSITFTNSSVELDTTIRVISFVVNDGQLDSNTVTRDIAVTEVELALDAKGKAEFIDADGDLVTVTLRRGGEGTLYFAQEGPCDIDHIKLTGTTNRSSLTIRIKGRGTTTIRNIIVDGSLKSISAQTTDLLGSITVDGWVGSIQMNDVDADHNITIGGSAASKPVSLKFEDVADLAIESQTPIKSLTVLEWLGGSLIAPWISSLSIKEGDFTADIVLYGSDRRGTAINKFTVAGKITDSKVIVQNGSMGTVTAEALRNSNLVCAAIAGDQVITTLSDLENEIVPGSRFEIKKLTIKGIKNDNSNYFINSNIAAANLGTVKLLFPQYDNSGVLFGLAADFIKKVSITDNVGKESFRNLNLPAESIQDIDCKISLV